jgi:hypothetical protein
VLTFWVVVGFLRSTKPRLLLLGAPRSTVASLCSWAHGFIATRSYQITLIASRDESVLTDMSLSVSTWLQKSVQEPWYLPAIFAPQCFPFVRCAVSGMQLVTLLTIEVAFSGKPWPTINKLLPIHRLFLFGVHESSVCLSPTCLILALDPQ